MSLRRISLTLILTGSLVFTGVPCAFADEMDTDKDIPLSAEISAIETEPFSAITDDDIASSLEAFDDSDTADADVKLLSKAMIEEDGVVINLAGVTQYDTASQEALYAYQSSEYAIIASGESSVDSLSAVSLAGALDCPILLSEKGRLPEATKSALLKLKSNKIIIVGGTAVVGESAAQELKTYGTVQRLYGETQYDTQIAIYKYGKKNNLWDSLGKVFVATGVMGNFADALSVSPLAFKTKAPVFLVDGSGNFPQQTADILLNESGFKQAIIAGGTAVVAETSVGFLEKVTQQNGGKKSVVRLAGMTLYDTSERVARWAVDQGVLSWDKAAFTTGTQPYDALAGGPVQGTDASVMLLIDEGEHATLDAIASSGAAVNSIKFLGGTAVVTQQTRESVCAALRISYSSVSYVDFNISLNRFAELQRQASVGYQGYSKEQILETMDPSKAMVGNADFYQYAVLSDGYSGLTAEQLDRYIASKVTYQEDNYRVTSTMRGTGAYFIKAAKTYNVNEVYLVAHAALESAWGCSSLAQGKVKGYEGYLNFYGIGAYDIDPNNGGAALAKSNGWNTAEKAIMGAAQWISANYLRPTVSSGAVSGAQDTLWNMKWDVRRAVAQGAVWHQYATARDWAVGVAKVMDNCYSYQGIRMANSGLRFVVPRFAG